MINATESIRKAMLSPVKVVYGQVAVQGGEIYTATDSLQSLNIKAVGYYFGTVAKSASIKLLGTNYALVGAVVQLSMLVQTSNEVLEPVKLGTFKVMEQTTDKEKGITTLTAYDAIGVLGKTEYTSEAVTYPCSVASLAAQIALYTGISITTEMANLPNANYIINSDLYANISTATFRDVLAEVAGATATIAIINENGDLEFRSPMRECIDNWTYANLIKLSLTPKYGPINSVVLARTPQEDNIFVRDEQSVISNGLTELKLANNEILDKDRQSLAQPILEAVNGFYFNPCTATTTGQGWYEVGDRIAITDDSDNTYETIVTETNLILDGGIKEAVKGEAPKETQTNYALAGGITRSINTTEIKVDKQNSIIESTVGRQEAFEGEVNNNFTNLSQSITNIVASVQNSGGSNLLLNSVGYVVTNGVPEKWDTTIGADGQLTVSASSEAAGAGSISKNIMVLNNVVLRQRISVVADEGSDNPVKYSFAAKLKKTAAYGTGSIVITDGIEEYRIDLGVADAPFYREYSIKGIVPKNAYLDVIVTGSAGSDFTVTDMIMSVGDFAAQWQQANGEFANTQVEISESGVRVKSSTVDGAYTEQNELGFVGVENGGMKAFELSKTQVKSETATISKEVDIPPLKIISQSNGWAIVKLENKL